MNQCNKDTLPDTKVPLANRFSRLLATPEAPIIFSNYLKIALHSLGILVILITLFQLIQSCGKEIQERYEFEIKEFEEKARICNYNYVHNDCGPNLRGLYWQTFCEEWDRCRNAKPLFIGKAKIATQVFGELMNGFVEPLNFKAMTVICILVFGFFIVSSLVAV